MKILLSNPRGFCAGVKRAISIVEQALSIYGAPIYVYHDIVHNNYVIDKLKKKGVIFVENINDVPKNKILIFSAHGVSKYIRKQAFSKNYIIFDATCPLVTKVHKEVIQASKEGIEVILIGHKEHPEVLGTIGQYNNINGGIYVVESTKDVFKLKVKNKKKLYFVTQTTLSIYEYSKILKVLYKFFPNIIGPRKSDICYATVNRQNAVIKLAKKSDILIIVGSKTSSNSNRLFEIAKSKNKKTKLIDNATDIKIKWFEKNIKTIGITSGASVPEVLVKNVVIRLFELGVTKSYEMKTFIKEKVSFSIPNKLNLKLLSNKLKK